MARVSVKYKYGENVCLSGIPGKVTAIFIRGKNRVYEFSYLDNNGNPTSSNAEECELSPSTSTPMGFQKK